MNRKIVSAVVLFSIVAVVAFEGCVGTNTSSGAGHSVEMKNIAFNPTTLTVKNGTTVTWYNNDTTTHTVTSDDGSFQSSGDLAPGQTYSVTFNKTGTFTYHCSIHPAQMKAKVVVQSGSTSVY